MSKSAKFVALSLLTALLLMAALNSSMLGVNAQAQATVIILDSVGGTTTPVAGTYNYDDGTSVTITANPDTSVVFQYWIVSTDAGATTDTDNPLTIPVSGGVTYSIQPVFQPILTAPGTSVVTNMATAAIVVVLTSAGGTTNPTPGTYALANAESLNLSAVADSGWKFDHWVISGPNLSHGGYPYTATPTDNPYNVNHGYGNRYAYQAVFTPIEAAVTPTPSIPEFSTGAALLISVALIVALIAIGTYSYRRRK
jgi:hypothetical protein